MSDGTFKKAQTKKKSAIVVEQILNLIREHKLREGDRLPAERYLSKTLGVSRGILREAIRALEIAGIIDARSGSGNYITSGENAVKEIEALSMLEREDNPLDIIMVRKSIEPLAVKMAVKNATHDDIQRMNRILDTMKKNYESAIIDGEIDGNFHMEITKASKNQTLMDVMKLIVSKMKKQKFWQYTKEKSILSLGHSDIYLQEHSRLLDAIKNRDEKLAIKIIKKHLNDVEKDAKKYFG